MLIETATAYHPDYQSYKDKYLASIPEAFCLRQNNERNAEANAFEIFLVDPTTTSSELCQITGLDIEGIRNLYANIRSSEAVHRIFSSLFYPRRIMVEVAKEFTRDLVEDPCYAERFLNGKAVISKTVEIHATNGSCDYICSMCLWSDKGEWTYRKLRLDNLGLLNNQEWSRLLREARQLGTKRILFSGGGEPLLKKDFFQLIAIAHSVGLRTSLFTNGYSLNRLSEEGWRELLLTDTVRFSIHSPNEHTYDAIVGLPKTHALKCVSENIREVLRRRTSYGSSTKVGVGFVIQPLNFDEIEQMAEFAKELGVDFLQIRQDEVDVTRNLNGVETEEVARQLNAVRENLLAGRYNNLTIDFSDDLTALANGINQETRAVNECLIKNFRPAISPFGLVGPCDLKVEPRFYDPTRLIGHLKKRSIEEIIHEAQNKFIPANCGECMPSGKTGNAIIRKLIADYHLGIPPSEQPFNF